MKNKILTLSVTLLLFVVSCSKREENISATSNKTNLESGYTKNQNSSFRLNGKYTLDIQNLKSFKNLLKLQENHSNLYKSKKIKTLKISKEEEEDFKRNISNVKSESELISLFAKTTTDPEESLNYLKQSILTTKQILLDIAVLTGEKDEKVIQDYYITAMQDFTNNKIAELKRIRNAKLDCYGLCNNSYNSQMANLEGQYNILLAGCASGAFAGYAGALASGPFAPLVAVAVGISEIACIGLGTYYYNLNAATNLDNFDICWTGCAQ